MDDRRARLKKGIDKASSKRRRQQLQRNFAARDRRTLLNKRRQLRTLHATEDEAKGGCTPNNHIWDQEKALAMVQQAVEGFRVAPDDEKRCIHLRVLTKELSNKDCDPHPIIEKIVEGGFAKNLTQLVSGATKNPDLMLQAMWCLTNIASGNHSQTEHVLPACPAFIQILSGTNANLKEHAVWAIGNIAADCDEMRHVLIKMGAFVPLSKIMQTKNKLREALIKTAAWAVSNLLRGRNPNKPAFYKLPFLKAFLGLLEQKDNGVAAEVCWCLTYLTSRDEQGCGKIIGVGFPDRVCALLQANSNDTQPPVGLLIPALRTIGNMLAYNDEYNQRVLSTLDQKMFLQSLTFCAKHKHRGLRKEATWVVGNILAGPANHVKVVVQGGWLPFLLDLLKKSQFDIKREAVYALLNASREPKVVHILVEQGIIASLLSLIKIDDVDTIKTCLIFVQKILDTKKEYVRLVEEAGGIEALETIQRHPNGLLWDHAGAIIDKHWGEDVGSQEDQASEPIEYPAWRVRAHQS